MHRWKQATRFSLHRSRPRQIGIVLAVIGGMIGTAGKIGGSGSKKGGMGKSDGDEVLTVKS